MTKVYDNEAKEYRLEPDQLKMQNLLLITARQLRKQMAFQPSTTDQDLADMDAALAPFDEVQS